METKPSLDPEDPLLPSSSFLGAEMELWEPPFERWLRLADTLLAEAAYQPANTSASSLKL